jgi:DNA gyrase subunit A
MKSFKLTDVQAQAILDMRLQRLTQLERAKIEEEYQNLVKLIADLEDILKKPARILKIIKTELLEIKEKYGDKRRTKFARAVEEVEIEDLIHEEDVAILITQQGFIKRIPVKNFRAQLRGGRGVSAMTVREEDLIDKVFVTSTHNFVLFFTNRGRIFRIKAFEIPEAGRQGKGQSVANFLSLAKEERITAAFAIKEFQKGLFLVMATELGIIKKTALDSFENLRRSGMIAIKLDPKDRLGWVHLTDGKQEILIATSGGMSIRFPEKDVRPMGRTAQGVKAVRLKPHQKVVSMDTVQKGLEVLAVTKRGFGKRVKTNEFRVQRRGGSGIKLIKLRTKLKDEVCRALLISPEDEIMLVTKNGTLNRQKASGISIQHRASQGVIVQRLEKGDEVVDVTKIISEMEDEKTSPANEEKN